MKNIVTVLLFSTFIAMMLLCYQGYKLVVSINEGKGDISFSFDDPNNQYSRIFIARTLLIQKFNHSMKQKFVGPINDYKIESIELVYDDPEFSVFETVYRVLPRDDPEDSDWYQANYESRYQIQDGWIIRHHRIRIDKKGTRYYLKQ